MFKKLIHVAILSLFVVSVSFGQSYKLVVHNVENLFDADGHAVYNDYSPDQYTPSHVNTKIQNMVRLLARYNNGEGPDVILFSEVESDHTPLEGGASYNHAKVLEKYRNTTLSQMLGEQFNDEIADLPSEILMLKGFEDYGLTGYDLATAYERDDNHMPVHVQKNVIFSRLPILHEKTRSHPLRQARPILEVWLDVDGHELALFANHWKSGASNAQMEDIRLQNARVLKERLDELREEDPHVDFILGGDFNSDYNQSYRYEYMDETAVNDVLQSVGDERKVKLGDTDAVYNLWYEYDISNRGSDTYRGYWGTLMQIMISPGMYDFNGVQYVDNSFDVARFPGKNVYSNSGAPNRWYFYGDGGGYSDHLPISMEFTVVDQGDKSKKITLENPGVNDDELWEPIPVSVNLPDRSDVIMPDMYEGEEIRTEEFFNRLFYIEAPITNNTQVVINGENYGLYAPPFNVRDRFADIAGTGEKVRFIGRLNIFRGNWQFVIEDEVYLNPWED